MNHPPLGSIARGPLPDLLGPHRRRDFGSSRPLSATAAPPAYCITARSCLEKPIAFESFHHVPCHNFESILAATILATTATGPAPGTGAACVPLGAARPGRPPGRPTVGMRRLLSRCKIVSKSTARKMTETNKTGSVPRLGVGRRGQRRGEVAFVCRFRTFKIRRGRV